MSVTRWDVTPRNACLGPCATVQWICFEKRYGQRAIIADRGWCVRASLDSNWPPPTTRIRVRMRVVGGSPALGHGGGGGGGGASQGQRQGAATPAVAPACVRDVGMRAWSNGAYACHRPPPRGSRSGASPDSSPKSKQESSAFQVRSSTHLQHRVY
jgi:hypothetical protein